MFETLFKYPLTEFIKGKLRLGSGLRPELAILAVAVAVLAAVYFYRRTGREVSRKTRIALSILRGFVLALLVLILFEPVLNVPKAVKRNSFVAVVLDDSRSMRIEDAGPEGGTDKTKRKARIDLAKELLGSQEEKDAAKPGVFASGKVGLLEDLAEICPVQLFKFSSRPEPVQSFSRVRATGERTDLFSALKMVDTELRGVSLAGIVVLTDGAINAGGAPQEIARDLRIQNRPVYCIGLGNPNPPRDYEVLRVQAPREIQVETAVEVFASVRVNGFDSPFPVELKQDQEVLQTAEIIPESKSEINRVKFSLRPEKTGTYTYTISVPEQAEEVIRDNNRRDFLVKVVDKRLPVLYLEGSPREEYRFLRRALYRDKDFRVVSILRLDGPKKYILQGAEDEDELKEAEDEDKLKKDESGLENGYPKTAEHLYRFQAVILGDIEATYLTPKQLDITEEFVRRRGGGFLMLGGVNSFNLGKYQKTPIEKMLPVFLPNPSVGYQQIEFNIELTEAGQKHPILRQSENQVLNRDVWSKAPTLIGYNPILEPKPGAEVLAVEPKSRAPILTAQKYGAGRTAAFLTGGSWHWRMAVPLENELHEKYWKQLVRWLAVGSREQLKVVFDKDRYSLSDAVTLRAELLDKEYKPINDAEVVATIEDPFGKKKPLKLEWILSEEGVYQSQFEPIDAGEYKITVDATLKDKTKMTAMAGFSVGETLDEFTDAGQNVGLLEKVASESGGKYVKPEEVGQVVKLIRERTLKKERDETMHEPKDIWDTPLLFGLMALALSVEWIIRRRASLV